MDFLDRSRGSRADFSLFTLYSLLSMRNAAFHNVAVIILTDDAQLGANLCAALAVLPEVGSVGVQSATSARGGHLLAADVVFIDAAELYGERGRELVCRIEQSRPFVAVARRAADAVIAFERAAADCLTFPAAPDRVYLALQRASAQFQPAVAV